MAKGATTQAKTERVADSLIGIGHNSGDSKADTDTEKSSAAIQRLRSIVERIERLEEERKALSSDIKDIFSEAKSSGFDTKVLRSLIAIRKRDAADVEAEETLLDVYRRALGM